jgi:hypothetical protein
MVEAAPASAAARMSRHMAAPSADRRTALTAASAAGIQASSIVLSPRWPLPRSRTPVATLWMSAA